MLATTDGVAKGYSQCSAPMRACCTGRTAIVKMPTHLLITRSSPPPAPLLRPGNLVR